MVKTKVKTFDPPIPLTDEIVTDEAPQDKIDPETVKKEQVKVRCPDCPWKAGLKDENTHCPTCKGTGQILADPLE